MTASQPDKSFCIFYINAFVQIPKVVELTTSSALSK